jgi:hypothetical protein
MTVIEKLIKERDHLYLMAIKVMPNSPRQNKIKEQIDHVNKLIKSYNTGLSESKTCSRVKGYKNPTTGKRVTTYARKKK